MNSDAEQTSDKLKIIEGGLRYLVDLDILDAFYDEIWIKYTLRLLERYIYNKSYYELPMEEADEVKQHVIEWFGEDYGLAIIGDEFWMISVGVDEGGNKWWYKIRINTDKKEIAQKVILLDKCLPGKYCNLLKFAQPT
jgi:hypothetical protein